MKQKKHPSSILMGTVLFTSGIKYIITQRFTFLYVEGDGAQAVAAGVVVAGFGLWWWWTFIKNAKEYVTQNRRKFLLYLSLLLLAISSLVIPIFFDHEALRHLFLAVAILALALSYWFFREVSRFYENQ